MKHLFYARPVARGLLGTLVMLLMAILARGQEGVRESLVNAPRRASTGVWPDSAPADCPFPKSPQVGGVEFTGRHAEYTTADTWYPSWASDGHLYSPFTDGKVDDIASDSGPKSWTTGNARIEGDEPLRLSVVPLGVHKAPATPYGGRYPCGSLVHNGIWYYGTYCLDWHQYAWDIMGPFVGFRISRDFGRTWEDTPCMPQKPLFGEAYKSLEPQSSPHQSRWHKQGGISAEQLRKMPKVKMGSPHFVDFGKNMQHSPDGLAYLLGHGATRQEATCSWVSGDQVYLARVKPSPETINDIRSYEFFAGRDQRSQPVWTKDFSKIKPLLEWNDHLGCVTATWIPALNRYLLCVTDGGESGEGPYDTMVLESEAITGPWRRVVRMENFGQQAYFVNIPSKFVGADGRTLWICYSHGWSNKNPNPPGSRYAMCLQEIRLLPPGDPKLAGPPATKPTHKKPE